MAVSPITKSEELVEGRGTLPKVDPVTIDAGATGTDMDTTGKTVDTTLPTVAVGQATPSTDVPIPTALTDDTGQVKETTKIGDIGEAKTGKATLTKEIPDIQGELSPGALAPTKTQSLDEKATVKYQLADLMSSVQEGKELPPWASPAVRKISAVMASRGMGASSMAAAAMTQAVIESGVPIAAADAQAYGRIQLQNLTNEQQTALTNAARIAQMDTANLNARVLASVNNAKNFLAIDTANLTAQQQANTLSYQLQSQAAFTDAAADNARKQFNAKNDLQMEEFFAELGSQVASANANRNAAMEQYNTSEANAMKTYNQSMRDSRERFNATAKFAIDQSNVIWRRELNTANTATQNETNRINVQNAYNASQNSLNNLWQMYRDNATFNFNKTESGLDREHAVGLMAIENSYNQDLLSQQNKKDLIKAVAKFVTTWVNT